MRHLLLTRWKWLAVAALVFVLVIGLLVLITARKYRDLAARYDLSLIGKMESASIVFDRGGKIIGEIFVQNRDAVPLAKMSPVLLRAVVAAEDQRFYSHHGADYSGIVRAGLRNFFAGQTQQGASTITQQLVRKTFGLSERSYQRKLTELALAQRVEESIPKEKIIESYLNLIYLGSGFYGVEAAARGYFGKSAGELAPEEAATLAGLIKSPNRLSPFSNPTEARRSRNLVLGRMKAEHFLSDEEFRQLAQKPLTLNAEKRSSGTSSYALETVRQQVVAALGFAATVRDGYRIHTTIDSATQSAAELSLEKSLHNTERHPGYPHETLSSYEQQRADALSRGEKSPTPDYLQGTVITIDNETGAIVAMVGGRKFAHSEFNRVLQARRPAGTAFTPIVYAAAMEQNVFPGHLVMDDPLDNRVVMIGGETGILGEWGVERLGNRYEGEIPASEAIWKAKNAAVVRLGALTGVARVNDVAHAMGIKSPLREYSSTFLGTSEVLPAEMALAFAAFPSRGSVPKSLHIVDEISDKDGHVIYRARIETVSAISQQSAYQTDRVLHKTFDPDSANKASLGALTFDAGGKNGTSYGFADCWFVGYNSRVTTATWVGFDRPQRIFYGAFGRDLAFPVWAATMEASLKSFPPRDTPRPEGLINVEVCRRSGQRATDRCRADGDTYFESAREGQTPDELCEFHTRGFNRPIVAGKITPSQWPRAEAVQPSAPVKAVVPAGPVLVAENDPYHSITAPPPPAPPAQPDANPTLTLAVATPNTTQILYPDDEPTVVGLPLNESDADNAAAAPTPPEVVRRALPAEKTVPELGYIVRGSEPGYVDRQDYTEAPAAERAPSAREREPGNDDGLSNLPVRRARPANEAAADTPENPGY